ncbi:MAG: metallophosphoesterase [Deltaproteobacteria bacterium]|nr:metallophosphoesterase [Deltaproteobacteria bacterium]
MSIAGASFPGGPLRPRTRRFLVLGDLQRTSRLELLREQNDRERLAIVDAMAQEDVDFVALLGDLVFRGDDAGDWARFDALTAALRSRGNPVLSVLGNHDYGVVACRARAAFDGRFPHLAGRRWSSIAYGPLLIVLLDTNRLRLSRTAWAAQGAWLSEMLSSADADPEVRGVLVLTHHPPYTNSSVTGDDLGVQRDLVPIFSRAQKTLAMLSGHVHSHERFARDGKLFVVSGGGGGPRAALHQGARRRHHDDLFAGPRLRPFHFLRVTVESTSLAVDVVGFDKGEVQARTLDAFALPLAARPAEG